MNQNMSMDTTKEAEKKVSVCPAGPVDSSKEPRSRKLLYGTVLNLSESAVPFIGAWQSEVINRAGVQCIHRNKRNGYMLHQPWVPQWKPCELKG